MIIVLHANDVASIIIARSGSWMDAMTLQKLLYYSQAWHLAIAGEPLFEERVKAWKNGPVVPQVWHERKDSTTRRAANQSIDSLEIDQFSSDLVDLVLAGYGSMSGQELSALTHVEAPWTDARGGLPEGASSAAPIPHEAMASFYRAHRKLGGRTAADLAAAGLHLRARDGADDPIDIDALLDSIQDGESDERDDSTWGGANLLTSGRASA